MTKKNLAPKDQIPAYQRWEMKSFDDPEDSEDADELPAKATPDESETTEKHSTTPEAGNPVQVEEVPTIVMPTEEQVAAVFQKAKEEGHTAGYQEGRATGYAEGRAAAEEEIKAEVARVQTLVARLEQDLCTVDQQMADQLLELALALTKKMVTQALKLKPELIVPIVQEAIRHLPNAMQHPRLYLHPDDAQLVATHLSEQITQENWSIREDEQLSRGGCRIEANGCEINGDLGVRWQKVLSALGQQNDWIERNE